MSDRSQVESALENVREVLRGDEASGGGTTFMRGLTLGALLGAAIAGSALWQRRARSKRPVLLGDPAEASALSDEA